MRIRLLTSLFCLTTISSITAKNLGVSISYARYLDDTDKPYLELYFAIAGNSLHFEKISDSHWQGKVDALVTISKGNRTIAASKFRVKTEALSDTNLVPQILLHQERMAVEPGSLLLFMELTEPGDTSKAYPIEERVLVDFRDEPCTADLLLLEKYEKTTKPTILTKSGLDLYPITSGNFSYLGAHLNTLNFYTELYHTLKMGTDATYAYRFYLKDGKSGKALSSYGKTKRAKSQKIQPVVGSINISDLPTGSYELILEIINKKGEVIFEKNTNFYRKASTKPFNELLTSATTNPQNFANSIKKTDTLDDFIKYLTPVSIEKEILMQQEIIARQDPQEMRNYLFAFWEQKFPTQAEEAWRRYLTLVEYVNRAFKSTLQPGYLSDRGVVYLKYGPPSQMEDRKSEPTLPPYQIWQYGTTNSPWVTKQTNVLFIFAEFQYPSNDYELIHSTGIGELRNERWRYQLANGKLGTDDLDQTRPDMGDEDGSRLNNNTLIMDRGN